MLVENGSNVGSDSIDSVNTKANVIIKFSIFLSNLLYD
jgi:hypothetical protein